MGNFYERVNCRSQTAKTRNFKNSFTRTLNAHESKFKVYGWTSDDYQKYLSDHGTVYLICKLNPCSCVVTELFRLQNAVSSEERSFIFLKDSDKIQRHFIRLFPLKQLEMMILMKSSWIQSNTNITSFAT